MSDRTLKITLGIVAGVIVLLFLFLRSRRVTALPLTMVSTVPYYGGINQSTRPAGVVVSGAAAATDPKKVVPLGWGGMSNSADDGDAKTDQFVKDFYGDAGSLEELLAKDP